MGVSRSRPRPRTSHRRDRATDSAARHGVPQRQPDRARRRLRAVLPRVGPIREVGRHAVSGGGAIGLRRSRPSGGRRAGGLPVALARSRQLPPASGRSRGMDHVPRSSPGNRRRPPRQAPSGTTDERRGPERHPAPDDVAGRVVASTDASDLRGLLAALPKTQREVIALAFYGQLSHSEISTHLDLPPGTVKGRMRLGLKAQKRDRPLTDDTASAAGLNDRVEWLAFGLGPVAPLGELAQR
jgi:hypothetical protein